MKAKYCYCKNTYSINCEQSKAVNCRAPYYWEHGIGSLTTQDSQDD